MSAPLDNPPARVAALMYQFDGREREEQLAIAPVLEKQSGTDCLLVPKPLRLLMAGGAAFLLSLAPIVFNFRTYAKVI